jgi:hypothetical protein
VCCILFNQSHSNILIKNAYSLYNYSTDVGGEWKYVCGFFPQCATNDTSASPYGHVPSTDLDYILISRIQTETVSNFNFELH